MVELSTKAGTRTPSFNWDHVDVQRSSCEHNNMVIFRQRVRILIGGGYDELVEQKITSTIEGIFCIVATAS